MADPFSDHPKPTDTANSLSRGVMMTMVGHGITFVLAVALVSVQWALNAKQLSQFFGPSVLMTLWLIGSMFLYFIAVGQMLYVLPMMVIAGINNRYQTLIGLLLASSITFFIGIGGGFGMCLAGVVIGQ